MRYPVRPCMVEINPCSIYSGRTSTKVYHLLTAHVDGLVAQRGGLSYGCLGGGAAQGDAREDSDPHDDCVSCFAHYCASPFDLV